MTKLTVKNNNRSIPKNNTLKKKIGGKSLKETLLKDILLKSVSEVGVSILMDLIFSNTKNNRIKRLEKNLEQMKIEMDKNKPLHLKVYDGIIKLFEKYPKILTALAAILTPALIYKLSKNLLGTKVTKVASPPKSVIKLMKMYLKKAS